MNIDIKQQIKEILLKENITMTDLVNRLNENKPTEDNKTTVASLNNKLTRGTIKHSEILEIAQVLGYNIAWQKSNEVNSPLSKSLTGAIIGTIFGGIPGGVIGSALGKSQDKLGSTTGSKSNNNKNIITGDDALRIAKEFEKENGYNPIMTDDEIYAMNHQEERLDLEHDIEINIEIIIKGIIEDALSLSGDIKSKIENYLKSKELPTSLKYQSVYRTIYKIVSSEYNDIAFLSFIIELRNIYTHGGFIDISDEMLNDLYKVSNYYINEFFINTKID